MLLAPFTFAVAILYPRTAAMTAGMLTVPTVFVVLAMATRALAGPIDSEVFPFLLSWMKSIGIANTQVTHLEALTLHVAGGGSLATVIAIAVAYQGRLVPDILRHVVWTSALVLPLTVFGYLFGASLGS